MTSTPQPCVVEIGGISVGLRTDDAKFLATLRQRYGGFLSSDLPEFELEFDLTSAGPVSDEDVHVRRDEGDWLLERGDFRARWNPLTGHGQVRQNANPYALDSVLRILHSLILADRGGFLLHAASGICDGKAYLFSGVSGAGKTTMTRLAPPDVTLLTDEISYIRGIGRLVAETEYRAFGTPFSGELAKPGENSAAPISALFFLEKGPENRISDLSPADAMRRLMRNILFFAEDPGLVEKILATACDFVSRVPSCRLMFYPDETVWDCIRQFEGVPVHV